MTRGLERAELNRLSQRERRWLARWHCACCDQVLDQPGYAAIAGRCAAEDRTRRRRACLRQYKPRAARPR
jgi:hypothetical protein